MLHGIDCLNLPQFFLYLRCSHAYVTAKDDIRFSDIIDTLI